uniref:Orcokinin-like n=1 Tax=Carabus violaceus TaxID=41075 RepID=A0A7U3MCA4_CARVO|nr:orcokinin-like [Carabus violaceus]
MNKIMVNFCFLIVTLATVAGANVPGQFPEENVDVYDMLLENAENEINVTPEKRTRGLDPMAGITFGGVKKRFDVLSGSSFGGQKRDGGNTGNEQRPKNIADVSAATVDGGQQLNGAAVYERHGTTGDRERSAFPGLHKKTLHPYYVQSIPLPLYYRLRDMGI